MIQSTNTHALPRAFRSIQILRGLACVAVVLFHSSMQFEQYYHQSLFGGVFASGYGGVDLFFVISGFVIAHSSAADLDKPARFKSYWYKRIIRIFPIYWAVLLAVVLGSMMVAPSAKSTTFSVPAHLSEWISTILLLPNHKPVVGVSWTLSYELFFYLMFSLLVLSKRFWRIPAGILAGSLVFFSAQHGLVKALPIVSFVVSPFNIEFAAGAFAWYLVKRVSLTAYAYLLMISVGLGVALTFLPTVTNENYSQRVLIFGFSSFLIVWALTGLEKSNRKGAHLPIWFDYVGDASYMLYLIHFPVLVFANKLIQLLTQDSFWVMTFNMVLVSAVVIISVYIHWHIEKPLLSFLKRRQKINTSPVLAVEG
jgi:exopolysaccharide production protein ExoZ